MICCCFCFRTIPMADKDPINFIKGLNPDPYLLCEKRVAESAHYNNEFLQDFAGSTLPLVKKQKKNFKPYFGKIIVKKTKAE